MSRTYGLLRALAALAALPLLAFALVMLAAMFPGGFDPLRAILFALAATLGLLAAWFALRGHIEESRARMRFALLGGLVLGGIGFAIGFFGPILWAPDANQGPLLGIFFTGPLGFVVGVAAGWLYGHMRK